MNIYNIDNDDHLHFECKAFPRLALLYFFITVDLEELPDFKKAHEKQEMEDLLLKDALKLILNFFEKLSDDVE